jgi:hypothetical protein
MKRRACEGGKSLNQYPLPHQVILWVKARLPSCLRLICKAQALSDTLQTVELSFLRHG